LIYFEPVGRSNNSIKVKISEIKDKKNPVNLLTDSKPSLRDAKSSLRDAKSSLRDEKTPLREARPRMMI